MGCGCGQRATRTPNAPEGTGATRRVLPDPSGAVIAAARAGGKWRLTTGKGSTYDFDTIADARTAQRVHGGHVDQVRR